MKKILYLAYNGLTPEISSYLKLVNQARYKFTVIVPPELDLYGEVIKFESATKVAGVEYTSLPLKQPPYIFFPETKENRELEKIIARVQPDLIIIQSELFHPNAAAIIEAQNKVGSKAKVMNFAAERYIPGVWHYLKRWTYFRTIIKGTDFICCRNRKELQILKKHWLLKRKILFYNYWGSDSQYFYLLSQSRKELIRANDFLGSLNEINQNDKLLGYIGRLADDKGLHLILEAMQKLPQEYKLVFAGEYGNKEYKKRISTILERKDLTNRCFYLGYVSYQRLNYLYSVTDLLVVPTNKGKMKPYTEELFGRVLPEAMLTKTLVIGSTNGAIAEVLGNTELIFQENDSKAIKSSIETVNGWTDIKKQEVIEQNFQRAQEMFTSKKYVERLQAFFDKNL